MLKIISLKGKIIMFMLIGIIGMAIILGGSSIYFIQRMVVKSYQDKALSVLRTVKHVINIEKYREVVNQKDANLEYYKEVSNYLAKVKKDTGAKYLYTAQCIDNDKKDEIMYIVDSYNSNEDEFSKIGAVDTDSNSVTIKKGEEFATEIRYQDEWGWLLSAYVPIIDNNDRIMGYIGIDFLASDIKEEINSIILKLIIIAFLIVVLMIIIMFKKLNNYFKPLKKVSEQSVELSNRNLTIRFNDNKKDEIGKMSGNLNEFLDVLTEIIKEIKEYSDMVAEESEELSVTINQISSSIDSLGNSSNSTAAAIEEMSANTIMVSKNVETLLKSSEETLMLANSGGEAVKSTITGINNIKRVVAEGTRDVKSLGNRTSEIGEIVNVINEIAAQTNLLALNAAIEAARAGEAGKGFEVVAEEVRKLAEKTTLSTKEIAKMVKEIQSETNGVIVRMGEVNSEVENGVKMANNTEKTLEDIVEQTEKLKDMINMIANSTKEQSIASEEIVIQTENIASSVEENGRGVEQSSRVINEIAEIADKLNQIVNKFKI
jgi:methyl-accepting chemotaxis protein